MLCKVNALIEFIWLIFLDICLIEKYLKFLLCYFWLGIHVWSIFKILFQMKSHLNFIFHLISWESFPLITVKLIPLKLTNGNIYIPIYITIQYAIHFLIYWMIYFDLVPVLFMKLFGPYVSNLAHYYYYYFSRIYIQGIQFFRIATWIISKWSISTYVNPHGPIVATW